MARPQIVCYADRVSGVNGARKALSNAAVTIVDDDSGDPFNIYDAEVGGNLLTPPFTTNNAGLVIHEDSDELYADKNRHVHVTATKNAESVEIDLAVVRGDDMTPLQILNRASEITAEDFGAVGSGSDETTELQDAIDTAIDENRPLILPEPQGGKYVVDAPLLVNGDGLVIRGQNGERTEIQQATAGENLFELEGDPDNNAVAGTLSRVNLEHLDLRGPAGGAGAGDGIAVSFNENASTYNGNLLGLKDVRIQGFALGLDLNHVDNSLLEKVLITQCTTGLHSRGNGNTIHAALFNASQCDVALKFEDGHGRVFLSGDIGSCDMAVQIMAGAQVTLIGGDFENNTGGTEFIAVEANGLLVGIGNHFKKVGGSDVPGYSVENGGNLVAIQPTYSGFATRKVIKKESAAAIVEVIGGGTNTTSMDIDENGTTSYPAPPFKTRNDNSIPTAAANYRGQTLQVMSRDSTNVEDRLLFEVRKNGGSTYEWVDLVGPREVGATTGASHARRDGYRRATGRKDVTLAAAAYTDVTVTVDTFTTLYSARATVQVETSGTLIGTAVLLSANGGTGAIVFRVHHPGDTGGGKGWKVHYAIETV